MSLDRKIPLLLIVAHPDDETLWFYGGLKKLTQKFEINILCLTYSATSIRGKELLKAMDEFNVNVIFGGLVDAGFHTLLSGVERCISQTLANKKYELVLTHPQHGGEKPHPHHIQCFHVARRLTDQHNIRFGFFCEKKLAFKKSGRLHKNDLLTQFRYLWRYIEMIYRIGRYPLLNLIEAQKECFYFLKNIFTRDAYSLFLFRPDLFKKQSSLAHFKSQMRFLENYNTYLSSVEYLYLKKYNKPSAVPFLTAYNIQSSNYFIS